jgi:hypothetical protein
MKNSFTHRITLFTLAAILAGAVHSAAADSVRGPLPDTQRRHIQQMAAAHQEIDRTVELTPAGYQSTTTSQNAEIAASLRAHVRYMQARMQAGSMVRHWDPAFAEMVAHHRDIQVEVEELADGIAVTVAGLTPEAIAVAQNHARIISGFVDEGPVAVRRPHEPVLNSGGEARGAPPESRSGLRRRNR